MDNKEFYVVKSLMLANSLTFITGQIPYKFDDINNKGRFVWSFKNDDNFKEAIAKLTRLKNKLHK